MKLTLDKLKKKIDAENRQEAEAKTDLLKPERMRCIVFPCIFAAHVPRRFQSNLGRILFDECDF